MKLREQINNLKEKYTVGIFSSIIAFYTSAPMVSAYVVGLPMMNLYDVFVVNVFGNFLVAVLALCLIFWWILVLGSISAFTSTMFCLMFILAMAIGYGQPIISILLFTMSLSYGIYQAVTYINTVNR